MAMSDDDLYREARTEADACDDRSLPAKIGRMSRKIMTAMRDNDFAAWSEWTTRRQAYQDELEYRRNPPMDHLDDQ